MKEIKKIICTSLVITFFLSGNGFPADIYYLGSGGTDGAGAEYQRFSLSKRIKDLFDFSSYGQYGKDRSGKISGRLMLEGNWQNVSGNKAKSFYSREDTDYRTELELSLHEKLVKDYALEGTVRLRKTDNPRIEPRTDLRMKQLSLRLGNDVNSLRIGDLYAEFSPFTLGSSLEGFFAQGDPLMNCTVKGVAARTANADSTTGFYQRNVFGGKVDYYFLRDSELFSLVRLGLQGITTQDDSSSAPELSSSADLDNTVFGFDGEIRLRRWAGLSFEYAKSDYIANDDAVSGKDRAYGSALRVEPVLRFGKAGNLRYKYYYVQPEFFTAVGSASRDKEQHQFTYDVALGRKVQASFVENLYWDHLESSDRDKRTVYDEKYIRLLIRPFDRRPSFSFRPYVNHLRKRSDDPANSNEADTTTVGWALSDRIWKAYVNTFYEYRAYDDKSTPENSTYFNRFGVSVSRDWQVFGRRLYVSGSYSTDLRNTKQDPDKDVNTGLSFQGQYDILDPVAIRFGHNIQHTNSAFSESDFRNFKSFLECDWLIFKKRATHLVCRGEYNRYDHEDGTQDYNETLVSLRLVSNF